LEHFIAILVLPSNLAFSSAVTAWVIGTERRCFLPSLSVIYFM